MTTAEEGAGDGAALPAKRGDIQVVRRAIRQDWPIADDVKRRILQRLLDILDPETDIGKKSTRRDVVAASRAVAEFSRLNLGQQAIDLRSGASNEDLASLTARAEAAAERRRRERAG